MIISKQGIYWGIGLLFIALVVSIPVVRANPLFFLIGQSANTSTATTTVSYMTPGTATTTIGSFDLGTGDSQFGADSAILALQLTGSTTPVAGSAVATTTYNVAIEQSQDAVDWYYNGAISTTTTLGWETVSGSLIASTTPTKITVSVPTATRYVRAVISIPAGSTNGAVWAQFIARRQIR